MNRDDAFVRQIGVLTLAGKPEKSVEYLQGKKFSYREGTSSSQGGYNRCTIITGSEIL